MIILFLYNIFIFFKLITYQYTFINNLNGKFSSNLNKFENDYWGTSIKELLSKSKKNNIFNEQKVYRIATCGLNSDIIKYYFNKNFKIEYKFVNTSEKYDYIIFINKIDTCSHTLEVLVRELQKSLDNELKLKSQIAEQKNSFYHLKL